MTTRKISKKQTWIIQAVLKGNLHFGVQTYLDMDQLLKVVPYETTKESMQFSLRHLIKRGYIVNGEAELRRGRKRRILVPTSRAVMVDRGIKSEVGTMKEFESGIEMGPQ